MKNQFRTNEFLEMLMNDISNQKSLAEYNLETLKAVHSNKIQELKQMLKLEKLDYAYSVSMDSQEVERFEVKQIEVIKYAVKIADTLNMAIYIVYPKEANGKTILYLHGHDSLGARGAIVINENKEPYHKNIPLQMAEAGFQVVIPELLGLGEAVYEYLLKGKPAIGSCFFNYAYLTVCGYDLTAIRVWQTGKVMDFIQKQGYNTDILFGVSGGGLVCEIVGVVDNRVENIIISSYVNTYEDSILAKEQCIDNYIHGIGCIGNSYEILALAAPKNLLLLNGSADRPFPMSGSQKAFAYIQDIYRIYDAEDKLQTYIFDGRHEINSAIVMEWLCHQTEGK